jgi:hypothetical protein
MNEIKVRYVFKRPNSYAGPYSPSDPKVQFVYVNLSDIPNDYFKFNQPTKLRDNGIMLGKYSILVSIDLFTGLTDKNKNNIYENDLIPFKDKGYKKRTEDKYVGTVKFDRGLFVLIPQPSRWNFTYLSLFASTLEDIGNVWENPELLKETTP